ncbi:HNH endonuclease signature motif containing protein [Okeania sp. SIO2C9]|uniref:HNH endonuclease signature motif containing protein n=1 Tax=Okeania sp. SIO2C9 TaxID=2607791 RepID=UPI0025D988E9|nr:HNH endonuclease signature motif containing protein [Okeania sp. SIO2C9]
MQIIIRLAFVIDGSHRLSSLSAWVNDDYGDGDISKYFYDTMIPDEQKEIADQTRKLVNKKVGSYRDFRLALTHPDKVKPEIVEYSKNLAALAIQLQWVEGDASKAENSYFKINQQSAPIDKTERKLLKSRRKPNSIAARAIIRSGKGNKYWSSFSDEIQNQIQEIAEEINQILFEPKLQTPIKTLDVPLAGKLYSNQTLSLILDFINIVNNIDFNNKGLNDDTTGETTIELLKKTRRIAYKLNSNHPSSLGLHPIVYFYSRQGRHRTVSFLAMVDFLIVLDRQNKLNSFIKVRKDFEGFILDYDYLTQQILYKKRSVQDSYKHISNLFQKVIIGLNSQNTIENIINDITSNRDFNYLKIGQEKKQDNSCEQDFKTNKKSEIYIRDTLSNAPRCKICNGFIHRNSIHIDHKQRKRDGGSATVDNGQITHPYCNSGYKN